MDLIKLNLLKLRNYSIFARKLIESWDEHVSKKNLLKADVYLLRFILIEWEAKA